MRKIKGKERKAAGNIYCSFCRPLKVDAIWRMTGIKCNHADGYACDDHKNLIPDDCDSDRITEADEQTWMNL